MGYGDPALQYPKFPYPNLVGYGSCPGSRPDPTRIRPDTIHKKIENFIFRPCFLDVSCCSQLPYYALFCPFVVRLVVFSWVFSWDFVFFFFFTYFRCFSLVSISHVIFQAIITSSLIYVCFCLISFGYGSFCRLFLIRFLLWTFFGYGCYCGAPFEYGSCSGPSLFGLVCPFELYSSTFGI